MISGAACRIPCCREIRHRCGCAASSEAEERSPVAVFDDTIIEEYTVNACTASLADTDREVHAALERERERQTVEIELIASENIVSRAVREALGHEITNKTLEGYPGRRFHGGGRNVDVIERLAIERARELFGAEYVNVQPHSGTQANQAVFFALAEPGSRILSMDLAAGGHLSHGAKASMSGRWFDSRHYGVAPGTGLLDYDAIEDEALKVRPALLIAGGSAYPRIIDFERMAAIAQRAGAHLVVDMAHIAGLVAAGVHPSPVPHADIVTCTTTKTLRGPRGGLILSRSMRFAKALQSAVFPSVQGSLHPNVLAAKAVCLGEALRAEFKAHGAQVIVNARCLGDALEGRGLELVGGGTDTHMVLVDLSRTAVTGQEAEDALARAGITSNKNPIPFDAPRPSQWRGLRLGVSAVTTRGFGTAEMETLGHCIADLILAGAGPDRDAAVRTVRETVAILAGDVASGG